MAQQLRYAAHLDGGDDVDIQVVQSVKHLHLLLCVLQLRVLCEQGVVCVSMREFNCKCLNFFARVCASYCVYACVCVCLTCVCLE